MMAAAARMVVLWFAFVLFGLASCRNVERDFPFAAPTARRPVLAAPTALIGCTKAPVAGSLEQRLDHDNSTDTRTWLQRYLVNEQFYAIGGPMFVMMALEGTANPDWLRGGQMMELALFYKAKAFLLEERFYGQSIPTPDTSVASLQYSSPEQTVGDLVFLVNSIKISHPGAKVILFGGSFGGSHVAWAKQKYPDLFDGAVVSSSPLLATFGFPEYMEEVANVMKLANEACVTDMKEAITATEDILFGTETGGDTVAELFGLCAPLNASNRMDVANFFLIFPNVYALVVENAPSLSIVQDYCNLITNPVYGSTPLQRLAEITTTVFHPAGCVEVRYDPILPIFQNTSWASPVVERRVYLHQTCAFYGDFQTTASTNQPFGSSFPIDIFVQICTDYYSPSYDAEAIQSAVGRTNAMFGGQSPNVTNTVFVQGSFDPWRVLGVSADLSDTATAIVIQGTSHIGAMGTPTLSDSDELKDARAKIQDLVGQWIA